VSNARDITPRFNGDASPDLLVDRGLDRRRSAPLWNGMLQEFRNRTAELIISNLDDVVARAVSLAGPALGASVAVTTGVGARTGIKNCGRALEHLLAVLMVDLAQAPATNVRLTAEVARGALEIEIEGDGPRSPLGPTRFALACDLAGRLGASISASPEAASYLVRFR
jgi:hypothetical protein